MSIAPEMPRISKSTDAEYRGATISTCEAIWLMRLLWDLQVKVADPVPIYYDITTM